MKRFSMILAALGLLSAGIARAEASSLHLDSAVDYGAKEFLAGAKAVGNKLVGKVAELGEAATLAMLDGFPGGNYLRDLAEDLQKQSCSLEASIGILYEAGKSLKSIDDAKLLVKVASKQGIFKAISILSTFGTKGLWTAANLRYLGAGAALGYLAKQLPQLARCGKMVK